MSPQTKEADKNKLNTFWREVLLLGDALATQPAPTQEELRCRAYETCLLQGDDPEDWLQAKHDLCWAKGNRA